MRTLKILTTLGLLSTSVLVATAAQAEHRYSKHDEFLSVTQRFERAANRMHTAVQRHGGHAYVAHKANRVARAARRLHRSTLRGAPPLRLRYRLNELSSEFRDLRRAYHRDSHLKYDRRVARSFRALRIAHSRLHRIDRWAPKRRPRQNVWYFSMSF